MMDLSPCDIDHNLLRNGAPSIGGLSVSASIAGNASNNNANSSSGSSSNKSNDGSSCSIVNNTSNNSSNRSSNNYNNVQDGGRSPSVHHTMWWLGSLFGIFDRTNSNIFDRFDLFSNCGGGGGKVNGKKEGILSPADLDSLRGIKNKRSNNKNSHSASDGNLLSLSIGEGEGYRAIENEHQQQKQHDVLSPTGSLTDTELSFEDGSNHKNDCNDEGQTHQQHHQQQHQQQHDDHHNNVDATVAPRVSITNTSYHPSSRDNCSVDGQQRQNNNNTNNDNASDCVVVVPCHSTASPRLSLPSENTEKQHKFKESEGNDAGSSKMEIKKTSSSKSPEKGKGRGPNQGAVVEIDTSSETLASAAAAVSAAAATSRAGYSKPKENWFVEGWKSICSIFNGCTDNTKTQAMEAKVTRTIEEGPPVVSAGDVGVRVRKEKNKRVLAFSDIVVKHMLDSRGDYYFLPERAEVTEEGCATGIHAPTRETMVTFNTAVEIKLIPAFQDRCPAPVHECFYTENELRGFRIEDFKRKSRIATKRMERAIREAEQARRLKHGMWCPCGQCLLAKNHKAARNSSS